MDRQRPSRVQRTFAAFMVAGAILVAIGVSGPASAHHARAEIWVGSPISGTWASTANCANATYPSAVCGWPTKHHTYLNGMPHRGDWGADLGVKEGAVVKLFAAPRNTSHRVEAKVEKRIPTCAPISSTETRAQRIARGGETVVIGLYRNVDGKRIRSGWVTYAHIIPTSKMKEGSWIPRWGEPIGTVGKYKSNKCWDGVHLHIEMTNDTHYSCFNRGYGSRATIKPSNFIGFVGGSRVAAARTGCP